MKTIIWDYNGTILNDVGISVKIENEMLERRGLKHDYSLEDYKIPLQHHEMFHFQMYNQFFYNNLP